MSKSPKKDDSEKEVSSGNGPSESTQPPQETGLTAPKANITPVNSDLPPDFDEVMKDLDAANQENIGLGEVQISRISCAQGLTKELGNRVAGWEQGLFFDNMTREIISEFGPAPWMKDKVADQNRVPTYFFIRIIPIMRLPSEYVLWPTKEERSAGLTMFHWKDLDATTQRVREGLWPPKGIWKAKTKGEAPPVTEHLNILCFVLNEDASRKTGLMLASFAKTSFKTGQKLVSSCQQQRANNLPFFGRVKYIFSEPKSEGSNTWQVQRFANGPQLVPSDKAPGFGEPQLARETFMACFNEAKQLADRNPSEFDETKSRGRYLQELYINAAQFDIESSADQGTGEDDSSPADDSNPTF